MQLVQRTTLFYQSGTSDKVYEVDLCRVANDPAEQTPVDRASVDHAPVDRYVVHFRYGRRGKALHEGVQTDVPISLEAARQVFDKLVAAKRKKAIATWRSQGGDDI
ncbi:MAG: hypothetical protein HC857_09880 [Synechococcales cyanobacterium RU_4_20]|nr:hypothetical protein [Synechococcales cyanobacterium RU_4_20]